MTLDAKKRTFLKYLFDAGFNGTKFKRPYYKRSDLIDAYFEYAGRREGFTELLDELVYDKFITMRSSQSGLLVEYSLSQTAIENLAAFEGNFDINSSKWTGLPSDFALTEERQQSLVSMLIKAEQDLNFIEAGNAEKAMARSYIIAAKALAEAPDPPNDLIWDILNRANQLSGIASLFVSILALFASIGS